MNEDESLLEALTRVRPEVLNENALKLFNKIMEVINERDLLKEKYDKALKMLSTYNLPCELDDFMNKNTDYCQKACGVDEEIFKKCWDKYIEQH